MSEETEQFCEMVREAHAGYVKRSKHYQLYCKACCKVTDHVYLGRNGRSEQYQCREVGCGLIYTAVTR